MTNKANFDLENYYDAVISPLMTEIITKCKSVGMPMLATFCFKKGGEEEKTFFCTTALDDGNGWQPAEIKEAAHIIRNGASTRPRFAALTITKERS